MVQVYAPASIGNIGVGFDTLGMAIVPIDNSILGDVISITDSDVFTFQSEGSFKYQLPIKLERNLVFQCWKKFCEVLGKLCPLSITLKKNVPVASGLGSSACSIVATLAAINCYYGYPLSNDQLLVLMGEMEGKISGSVHLDNVLPCFLGGMRLIVCQNKDYNQIVPIFENWIWILAYPGIEMSTKTSRSILPKQYLREDCVRQSRNLSGFIHACHTKQEDLAIQCMQDVIAEPYRSKLLPIDLFYIRRVLLEIGAVSCGIAGSGPTVFVLCNTKDVIQDISDWLLRFYLKNNSGFVKVCILNNYGVQVTAE